MTDSCYYCKKLVSEEDTAITVGYWTKVKNICHKACKVAGDKEQAYECQCIDADCNDCKYFERDKKIAKGIFSGKCLKFNKKVKAYPVFATGHDCFEHRRDNG